MSKIPPKHTFPQVGLYSPALFRVRQVQVTPSTSSTAAFYGQNQVIEFNIGGGSNSFVLPESAFLSYELKVHPNDAAVPGTGSASEAGSVFNLPRPHFGYGHWQEVDVKLDRTRSVFNASGAQLIRDYMNGRLVCAPYPLVQDVSDLTTPLAATQGGNGLRDVTRTNGHGPTAMCGFLSNAVRIRAFAGVYRTNPAAEVDPVNPPTADKFRVMNGGLLYRVPLSLFCGLFGPGVSASLPIGLMSQSSESGIQLRLRCAQNADVIQAPLGGPEVTSTLRGTTAVTDNPGVTGDASYGIYSPVITYREVQILDQGFLAGLQAIFNGEISEDIMVGGQMLSTPRLLTISYPRFDLYQYVHASGQRNSFLNISSTEPSVKGIMIRLTRPLAAAASNAVEAPTIKITSLQIEVGNQVYPLVPVIEQLSGNFVPLASPVGIAAYQATCSSIRDSASTDVVGAQLASWFIDGKSHFSPFPDYGSSWSNSGDLWGYQNSLIQSGEQGLRDTLDNVQSIRPIIFSFSNESMLSDVRSQDHLVASGIDMRGVGNMTIRLSLQEKDAGVLVNPTASVNVTVALVSDEVLKVARNILDPNYAYTMFS